MSAVFFLIATLPHAAGGLAWNEEQTLAQVVDSPGIPEAAELELPAWRLLLGKVRSGPAEPLLRYRAARDFTYGGLLDEPDRFRGEVAFAYGLLLQMRRTELPGAGIFDRDEIYAGIIATPQKEPYAFIALKERTDPSLCVGDRVHLSGYFLKNLSIEEGGGRRRRIPLLVAPWPALVHPEKRVTAGRFLQELRKTGHIRGDSFPTRPWPRGLVRYRMVLDVMRSGREGRHHEGFRLGGRRLAEAAVVRELRRYVARGRLPCLRPAADRAVGASVESGPVEPGGRLLVVRLPEGTDIPDDVQELLSKAEVTRVVLKRVFGRVTATGRERPIREGLDRMDRAN